MKHISLLVCFVSFLAAFAPHSAQAEGPTIFGPENPTRLEDYAVRELARYVTLLGGSPAVLATAADSPARSGFVLGRVGHHALIDRLVKDGLIAISEGKPGAQGYLLKSVRFNGCELLVMAAKDEPGVLYSVYGLGTDHFGVTPLFSGDIVPSAASLSLAMVDEVKTPVVATRGLLPWTNFPQSPSSYSWEDWKFILDQMARMRLNFLMLHNYNFDGGNEPFHNFEIDGVLSRSWMPSSRQGHSWGGTRGMDPNAYRFGAADLFDDYDFGSDVGLHNEGLDNRQVFRKGVNLFRRILDYAHTRGIKVALGIELNSIPSIYKKEADDPRVAEARVRQIVTDYPHLDYLTCFFAEGGDPVIRQKWRSSFDHVYSLMKELAPGVGITVSGWGLPAKDVSDLPADVTCSPISFYSAKFDSGLTYGDRETWGCPWMERDFTCGQYYYPYQYNLEETVNAWRERAPNLKGLFTLTWRLTDAIAPKLWFVSQASWDTSGRFANAADVYRDFSRRVYGEAAADRLVPILNNGEPVTSDWGECGPTRPFELKTYDAGPVGELKALRFIDTEGKTTEIPLTSCQSRLGRRDAVEAGTAHGLTGLRHNDWFAFGIYPRLKFGPGWEKVQVVASGVGAAGMRLEFRTHPSKAETLLVEAPNGPLIGEVEVPRGKNGETGVFESRLNSRGRATSGDGFLYVVVRDRATDAEIAKAEVQMKELDGVIAAAKRRGEKERLGFVKARIAATRDHNLLNRRFSDYEWNDLPGAMSSWVANFIARVDDISMLGNVSSIEKRYVQKNYLPKDANLRTDLQAEPPADVEARGTQMGALLTWRSPDPLVRGFVVYRNNQRIAKDPLPVTARTFTDTFDGAATYTVSALRWDDQESPRSTPVFVAAGTGDRTPPRTVVISPPTSARAGQPVDITVRLLDDRLYELQSATLLYRAAGEADWTRVPMERRVRAIFVGRIPAEALCGYALEYAIESTDGSNVGLTPVDAPAQPYSLTVEAATSPMTPPAPEVAATKTGIAWKAVPGADYYRIYRGMQPSFHASSAASLTFLAADANLNFADNGLGRDGRPLAANTFYRVSAVTRGGVEGPPSSAILARPENTFRPQECK